MSGQTVDPDAARAGHLELVGRLSRSPHEQAVGLPLADDAARGDEVLRLACLNYGADDPGRWQAAARLLAAHTGLVGSSLHVAAAAGDVAATTKILAADRQAVSRQGGPIGWQPLLYLTYSRLERMGADPVAVARILLDAGPDGA